MCIYIYIHIGGEGYWRIIGKGRGDFSRGLSSPAFAAGRAAAIPMGALTESKSHSLRGWRMTHEGSRPPMFSEPSRK